MPLPINLRQLEKKTVELDGTLTDADLELVDVDELVRFAGPLEHHLVAERMDNSILVQGNLKVNLNCECARCLKPLRRTIELADWACDLALEGEDKVPVDNDCVDLTPFIREDILLSFPQHPLCEPECGGLINSPQHLSQQARGAGQPEVVSSAWAELNKLKF